MFLFHESSTAQTPGEPPPEGYVRICPEEKNKPSEVAAAPAGTVGARVYHGNPALDECSVVAIRYRKRNDKGPESICTGTIIGQNLILTAGHCGCGDPESYIVSMRSAVRSDEPFDIDKGDARIKGKPILFDHDACTIGSRHGNDLALLMLDADIGNLTNTFFGYAADAKYLAGNMQSILKVGQPFKVVGYGRTEFGTVGERRKANIPLLTPNCLEGKYRAFCQPYLEMILSDSQAARNGGRDSCGGDSGGPVFLELPANVCKAKSILIGVTSRAAPLTGNTAGQHCGGGGIYTLLGRTPVQDWLASYDANPIKC